MTFASAYQAVPAHFDVARFAAVLQMNTHSMFYKDRQKSRVERLEVRVKPRSTEDNGGTIVLQAQLKALLRHDWHDPSLVNSDTSYRYERRPCFLTNALEL